MKTFSLLAGLLCVAGSSVADTTWVAAGNVLGAWTPTGTPYIIQGNIQIATTDTLGIESGVEILFAGPYTLSVVGSFFAIGAPADSILFTTLVNGDSSFWGGIYFAGTSDHPASMDYCIVEKSSYLVSYYAALSLGAADLQLSHSTVRDCYGSGIIVMNSFLTMADCDVVNCGRYGPGGALLSMQSSQVAISSSRFINNASGEGALSLGGSTATIDHCLFENDSGSIFGGAIAAWNNLSVSNSTFHRCYSDLGGAIYTGFGADTILVDHCAFFDNIASQDGGGIYQSYNANVIVRNCTFGFNRSLAGTGGAIRGYINGGISNCLFVGHTPDATHIGNSPVHHNAFFNNTVDVRFPQPGVGMVDRINARGDSCDQFYNLFALDPLLADTAVRDFHIVAGSPCIDAGDSLAPLDPDSTIADIGALFFDQSETSDGPFAGRPTSFTLSAYPNPFNATQHIQFSNPRPAVIRLTLHNIMGEQVAVLWDQATPAGEYTVSWNAIQLPSGTYFAALQAGDYRQVQKLLLLR